MKSLEDFHRKTSRKDGRASHCKVCHGKTSAKWRDANRESLVAYSRRWYAENPERARELNRRWHKKHPARRNATNSAYRARKMARTVNSDRALSRQVQVTGSPCVYCGVKGTEADHVVALDAGGPHDETNLVSSHPPHLPT